MKKKLTPWMLLTPILSGTVVFFLIPFLLMLYYSVTSGIGGRFVGLQNYIEVLNSSAFRLALRNTIRFWGIGVFLNIWVSFGLALLIRQKFKGVKFIRSILLLPMMVGVASIVLFLQRLLEGSEILAGPGAFGVLLGLYIWKNCGYNIILFTAGLNMIPEENYDCAELEGASGVQMLRWITLPMMIPSFFFVFIISIINCFKTYREAFLLCGEHPHESIYMIQHFLNNNFNNLNYQRLSVATILLFLFIAVFVAIFYRLQKQYEEMRS